ncbi:MAG TPA: HSP20 family small heat-shock protein [Polyangiaceae bacterium]|nr:HSP20 family small heat-shock protein [Polyangiaceae bacterium]
MANISVRKQNGNRPGAITQARPGWEPLRVLRELMNWDPFGEMAPQLPELPAAFEPSFEVKESKDGYVFNADVPGVKEPDLEVTVTGNRLTISGKREAEHREQTDRYYTYERSYGDFMRAFTLPEGVDMNSVNADLKDGVLTVTVKKTAEVQPKKVAIQSAAKKS